MENLDPQFHVLHSRAWRCAHYLKELGTKGRGGRGRRRKEWNRAGNTASKAESNGCECNSPTGLKPAPRTSEAHRGKNQEESGGECGVGGEKSKFDQWRIGFYRSWYFRLVF